MIHKLLKFLPLVVLVFLSNWAFSQNKISINGYVKDAATGESLIGASIKVKDSNKGNVSNVYGYYSISLPAGQYTIVCSYIGYEPIEEVIDLKAPLKKNFELKESSKNTTNEVKISATRPQDNVKSMEMSVSKLDIKSITKIPALLGEVDVIRSIQLLPGVSTVGEGATGFNVRGGNIDNNLVLQDEAPVYNSSHLFGFFSVFNPDAVKDVKLVKGGIPAQYGGRTSSLLDVRMKEGNNKQPSIAGGLGLIFSRITVEAPIVKDKASFIVAGRRSYGDVFLKLSTDAELKKTIAYFYDFSAKANYEFSNRDKLFISGYFGRDRFGFSGSGGFSWGNATTSLRWNHVFNDKLFLNATAFFSQYDYALNFSADGGNSEFNWNSNIVNYSVKPEFSWFLNNENTITFGGQSILYNFKPGTATAVSKGDPTSFGLPKQYALESGIYAGNEQKISARLSVQYGLRYSLYQYLGSGKSYTLGDTTAGIRRPILATQDYTSGQVIKQYTNPEPRFSAKYELNENSSIKASYNRMAQYIQLISNSIASSPLDVWRPATNNLLPQLSDQVALGYFKNFNDNMFETSVEVYYKTMTNQLEYVSNADLLLNEKLEADVLRGNGRAYGAEFFFKKNTGALTGFISYTLSKTERQINGVNNGDWYVAKFDRTHNLNVIVNYEATKKWSFGTNFIYSTGTPATFPSNRINYQGIVVPQSYTGSRNNVRQPAYIRMDVSVTWQRPTRNKGPKWYQHFESNWVFSVYNVLARRNPFTIYFQPSQISQNQTEAVRFSIFGTFIPSVTYNFKF